MSPDAIYSYTKIATYLGFSSQSHFGKVFKSITGMTPRKYRETYMSEDFMNDTIQIQSGQDR
ncbi:MAG: AraC family transcriptional regulator [Lachnospiraceae bacterium]|nr:AraC family transcriptional regulator [Lachnospiraceae bacterium]